MRNGTWKMLAAAALLCPAFVFTGCKSGGHGHDQGGVTLAEPVSIIETKSGDSSALKDLAGVRLIKTQSEYDALGDANIYPGVDFDANDLVIASLGVQPTGGYAIQITAIQQEGDTLVVVGKASKPAADAVVTQALTYPYAAAVIANTDATIAVPDID